jgi:hypothetical protein
MTPLYVIEFRDADGLVTLCFRHKVEAMDAAGALLANGYVLTVRMEMTNGK